MCGTPQGATVTRTPTSFPSFPLHPYLCNHGVLTYSGDKIQVPNTVTGFHSCRNLCKEMCMYFLNVTVNYLYEHLTLY